MYISRDIMGRQARIEYLELIRKEILEHSKKKKTKKELVYR